MFSFFKKKKPEFDITSLRSTVTRSNGDVVVTQVVPAKVIEVGDDEAEDGFSYKYSFINPMNSRMEEATDYLQTISVGEQLFEVGDDVNLLFTSENGGADYSVTRQLVFPEELNKKENIRKVFKAFYIAAFIISALVCCYASYSQQLVPH